MKDIKTLKTLNDLKAVWYRKQNTTFNQTKSFTKSEDSNQHLKSLKPSLNSLIYPNRIKRKINYLFKS